MAGTLSLDPQKAPPSQEGGLEALGIPSLLGAAALSNPEKMIPLLTIAGVSNPHSVKKMLAALSGRGQARPREQAGSMRLAAVKEAVELPERFQHRPFRRDIGSVSSKHEKMVADLLSGMPPMARARLSMSKDPENIRNLIEKNVAPMLHRHAEMMGGGDPVVGRLQLEKMLQGSRSGADVPFQQALQQGAEGVASAGRLKMLKRLGLGAGAGVLGYMLLKRILGRKPNYQKVIQQQQPQMAFMGLPQMKAAKLMEKWADFMGGYQGGSDFLSGGGGDLFGRGRELAHDIAVQMGKVINPAAQGAMNIARGGAGLALGGAETLAGRTVPLLGAAAPVTFAYHGLRRPRAPITMPVITRAGEFGEQEPTQLTSTEDLSKLLQAPGMRASLGALDPSEIARGTRARLGAPGPLGLKRLMDYALGRRLVGGGSVGKFLSQLGKKIEGPGSLEHKLMRMMPGATKKTLHQDVANLLTRAGHGTSADVREALGQTGELGDMPLRAPGFLQRIGPLGLLAGGAGGGLLLSRLLRGR